MTSASSSFPERLTKIDALTRADHHYLREEDNCFFLGEYTARAGFAHSATNDLIMDFKMPMDRQGRTQWRHKASKIAKAARALHKALQRSDLRRHTFVPVPPSKAKGDQMYDDRMMLMLRQLSDLIRGTNGYPLDIRELVSQPASTAAAHDGGTRPTPEDLATLYQVDQSQLPGVRERVVICDDVLTTGCHYRAMCSVLAPHLPQSSFQGLFLARRVPQADDFSAFFDDE